MKVATLLPSTINIIRSRFNDSFSLFASINIFSRYQRQWQRRRFFNICNVAIDVFWKNFTICYLDDNGFDCYLVVFKMPSNGRWIVRRRRKFGFGFSATRHALTSRRRSAEHSYESAQEFFTAVGLSYLRSAGRRRRGTILDTSAGAGTCSDFSLSFSPCLSPPLLSLFLFVSFSPTSEGKNDVKVGRRER